MRRDPLPSMLAEDSRMQIGNILGKFKMTNEAIVGLISAVAGKIRMGKSRGGKS